MPVGKPTKWLEVLSRYQARPPRYWWMQREDDMEARDVKTLQTALVYLGLMIQGLKLDDYIEVADDFDNFAPFFDPTAWMERGDKVLAYVKLAKALREFQVVSAKVIENDFRDEKIKSNVLEELPIYLRMELLLSDSPLKERLLDIVDEATNDQ